MKDKFLPYEPDQPYLFPPSPQEWLPKGHLAYFISETVDELDLSEFTAEYSSDERGEKAYDPRLMLKVLLYGYSTGTFSSRKITKRVEEDVAYRYLAAGLFPSHRTIRRFRQRHLDSFQKLFVEVVEIAREAKLIRFGVLAIDGTKIKANANKHKAMSYERMLKEEKRLKKEITELLRKAEVEDVEEDRKYGEDKRGDEIPKELQRREDRLAVIRAAKARLKERQREKDRREGRGPNDDRNASGPRPQGGRSKYRRKFGVPEKKAQDNFTDPESRIMKTSSGGFEQCYNAQAAVDGDHQIIVAASVTQCAADAGQLIPVVDQVTENLKVIPRTVLADSGYCSERNLQEIEGRGIEPILSLGREGKRLPDLASDLEATKRLKRRLQSERGSGLYKRRKAIIEPVFGMIKQVLGFRMFLLRGYENVAAEWALVCCALNLKRMNGLMQWN